MNSLGRKRYTLVLFITVAEGAAVVSILLLMQGTLLEAMAACCVAIASAAGSGFLSARTREYAKGMYPKSRPPLSWTLSFVVTGTGGLVLAIFLLGDAFDKGSLHFAQRVSFAFLLLYLSSFLQLGLYHLARDVPRNSGSARC